MFFNNRRVEEDLERIRRANLDTEEQKTDTRQKASARDNDLRITAKDILAMTIAVFSLILPYLAAMAITIGLVLLWFFR